MWYEENDQFVRAPTPQAFDSLVQNLEARDSVMFESIRLPSSKNGTRDSTTSVVRDSTESLETAEKSSTLDDQRPQPIQTVSNMISSLDHPFELPDDEIDDGDVVDIEESAIGPESPKINPLPPQLLDSPKESKVYNSRSSFQQKSLELGSTLNSLETSGLDLTMSTSSPNLVHMKERIDELTKLNKQKEDEIIQKDIEIIALRAQVDAQDPRVSSRLNYKALYESAFLELTKLKEALKAQPPKTARKIKTAYPKGRGLYSSK